MSNLTAYKVEEYHRSPAEAALRDFKDVFLVDEIVSGESDNDPKGPVSTLKLRVSWVGFPGEDTIESWRDVRNLEQLRRFLTTHPSKDYRDLIRKLPKSNRVDEEDEAASDERVVNDLITKPKKSKKKREKRIRQVADEEVTNEVESVTVGEVATDKHCSEGLDEIKDDVYMTANKVKEEVGERQKNQFD